MPLYSVSVRQGSSEQSGCEATQAAGSNWRATWNDGRLYPTQVCQARGSQKDLFAPVCVESWKSQPTCTFVQGLLSYVK
jgi:hypothetical protein